MLWTGEGSMEQQELGQSRVRVRGSRRRRQFAVALDRAALPEHEIVALAKAGDGEAFALLVRRHERGVYAFAYRYFNDPFDADDAVQETFARVYTRLHTYSPPGRFGSWLLAICSHWCIDTLRSRRSRIRTVTLGMVVESEQFISELAGPEEAVIRHSSREEVAGWLGTLPAQYRTVLALHYAQEYSYSEIAQALNVPLSTVRMRLFRARAALRTLATA
jgi:RNA polymerase sigma-70 factor (ECF subfamily)